MSRVGGSTIGLSGFGVFKDSIRLCQIFEIVYRLYKCKPGCSVSGAIPSRLSWRTSWYVFVPKIFDSFWAR
ncbi:hypothetical protein D9M73_278550 [compost metagenome]